MYSDNIDNLRKITDTETIGNYTINKKPVPVSLPSCKRYAIMPFAEISRLNMTINKEAAEKGSLTLIILPIKNIFSCFGKNKSYIMNNPTEKGRNLKPVKGLTHK
jgi:hypothetical protein